MAVLEIKKFNNPVLKRRSEEVEKVTRGIRNLVRDMIDTMGRNKGMGLAAPQVGVGKRIIVVFDAESARGNIFALVNPIITKKSRGLAIAEEGCLSIPGVFLKIKRAKKIEIAGQNLEGEKIRATAEGLLSRVLQHEIDHLNGILIYERLSIVRKIKFKLEHREFNR